MLIYNTTIQYLLTTMISVLDCQSSCIVYCIVNYAGPGFGC